MVDFSSIRKKLMLSKTMGMQGQAPPSAPQHNDKMQLLRGMWIWNTAQLLDDPTQINHLVSVARAINLTDVYLYVAPTWWNEKETAIADFNNKVQATGIHVWALDGDVDYIDNPVAEEHFMQGLQGLSNFNKNVRPGARFYGFQADIEPQDTADHPDRFINGVAESRLTPEQRIQRDTLMHKWLNTLTRASNLVHSHDLQFGAAMPFWLHNYEGEPITVPGTIRRCVMDLIMPLVDEYVVMSYNTNPANAAGRILQQAKYASEQMAHGKRMPRLLGSVEVEAGVGEGVSYGDTFGKKSKAVVLNDVSTIERTLGILPSFGGMAIHHWAAWMELPR